MYLDDTKTKDGSYDDEKNKEDTTSRCNTTLHSFSPEITISNTDSSSSCSSLEPGKLYKDWRMQSPSTRESTRIVASVAGWLIPVSLLINGSFYDAEFLATTIKHKNMPGEPQGISQAEYFAIKIPMIVICLIATTSFVLRCLNFDVMVTTVITVFCIIVSGILLLVLSVHMTISKRLTLSVADTIPDVFMYFVGVALFITISALLIIDYVRVSDFRRKGSGIPKTHMLLLFSIISVYSWAAFGGIILHILEDTYFYIGFYASIVSMTTIGFGDVYPTSIIGEVAYIAWASIGMVITGIFLVNTKNVVVDIVAANYTKKIRERQDLRAKKSFIQNNIVNPQNKKLKIAPTSNKKKRRSAPSVKTQKIGTLLRIPSEIFSIRKLGRGDTVRSSIRRKRRQAIKLINNEFAWVFLFVLCLWIFLSTCFYFLEKRWLFFECMWFTFVAFTTIGYGDHTLESQNGIIFFTAVSIFATSSFTALLVISVDIVRKKVKQWVDRE